MVKRNFFKNKTILILLLILSVGAFLRLYRLAEIPVGFHIDEAQVGYNAYSIWKTGRDETGRFLPSHLKIWNFERPLGITYLSIPGIMVFGLNEFGTRIDTAMLGTLTILLIYYFTLEITGNKKLSLITSFLLAISPWHINLSRATSDAVVSLFFYILGTFFCWRAFNKDSKLLVFFSYFAFLLSFFSYYATRLAIPVILILFIILSFRKKKKMFIIFIVALVVYLVFPFSLFIRTSTSRFNQVSIFQEQGTKLLLEEQIREDGSNYPVIMTRIAHNKVINFLLRASENSLSYFTFDYLIFKGGLPFRYLVPNMGVIYFVEFPFLIWGAIRLFSRLDNDNFKNSYFFLIWLLLGIFSASLTIEETPNYQRALFLVPCFQWVTGIGLLSVYNTIKVFKFKNILYLLFSLSFLWNIYYFWHQYTVHTVSHRPWYRYFEMKELVYFMDKNADQYKKKIMSFNSTEPYIYFLFYNKTDPQIYQKKISEKGLDYLWNNIEGITLSRRDCPVITNLDKNPNTLIAYKIQCWFPLGSRVVKKIKYSDGETSLVAVDFPNNYKFRDKSIKYEDEIK